MNGIGKIAAGMVGQATASQEAKSRTPWITGALKTRKHQSNVQLGFQALALGSSMYSTYKKGIKPHEDIQAGAKEAGVEMDEASFGEKLKIGFGFQDVGLDETYEGTSGERQEIPGVEGVWGSKLTDDDGNPYKVTAENVTEYSGATLMDIGARAKSGTLESYMKEQGEGKTVGDVFGKDVTAEKFWDTSRSDSDSSYGTYQSHEPQNTRPMMPGMTTPSGGYTPYTAGVPTHELESTVFGGIDEQPRASDPFLQEDESKTQMASPPGSMMAEVESGYASPEGQTEAQFDPSSIYREGSSLDEQGFAIRGGESIDSRRDPEGAFNMLYGKPMGSEFTHDKTAGIGWLGRGDSKMEVWRKGQGFDYQGQMHGLKGLFGN